MTMQQPPVPPASGATGAMAGASAGSSLPPEQIEEEHVHPTQRLVYSVARWISYAIYAVVVFVELILALGFILLLLGANPTSGFVEWAYRNLDRAMKPFRGIFAPIELGQTSNEVEAVLDTSVLFAMIVYLIVALVVHALITWLTHQLRKLDRADAEFRRQQLYGRNIDDARSLGASAAATGYPQPTPPPTQAPGR